MKMSDKNKLFISYSKQVEVFNNKVKSFQLLMKNATFYANTSANQTLVNLVNDAVNNLSIQDSEKYYSLLYFYKDLEQIRDFSQPTYIQPFLYILSCLIAEKYFKTNDKDAKSYLDSFLTKHFTYEVPINTVGRRANIQSFQFFLSSEQKDFINQKLSTIILKGMVEDVQQKMDKPKILFNKLYDNLAAKEQDIQKTLNNYQLKAEALADFIKTQQSNLNFVGLGKAFKQITKEKNTVKNKIEKYLIYFFIALLGIPFLVGLLIYFTKSPNYYLCIPATTIELLILYAFRLFYQQYLFVKSELLQVNLRHSLCAFIESYMEFKKDNKDNTVDLFEQLIFSNIISDEKKVPATVDGLESIAELIRCVKK
ncbi:MAG: hypothetical protein ACLT2E_05530 [Alphaproteobacteria bacterium]